MEVDPMSEDSWTSYREYRLKGNGPKGNGPNELKSMDIYFLEAGLIDNLRKLSWSSGGIGMHKFFTEDVRDDMARITGDDVKHAWKVLRLESGDVVQVNDLKGTDYLGTIVEINKNEVLIQLGEKSEVTHESPLQLFVYQGLPKGQKMDLICQKVCELGVSQLIPTITDRVIPDVKNDYKKLDRLRRISLEAGKQAKRSLIMTVREPVELYDLAEEFKGLDLVIVPYEEMTGQGMHGIQMDIAAAHRIGVVVGPEGGFAEEEINWLSAQGAKIVTLGPRILRTETCALSVVSILQFIAGDMGGAIREGRN